MKLIILTIIMGFSAVFGFFVGRAHGIDEYEVKTNKDKINDNE